MTVINVNLWYFNSGSIQNNDERKKEKRCASTAMKCKKQNYHTA